MTRVLLYNFSDEGRRKTVKAILFRLKIPCRDISPEDQNHPLGYLLGLDGYGPGENDPEPPFSEEMLVMCGLTPRQFNGLLDEMKKVRLLVPLKAVVTAHNVAWSSGRLKREIEAEHRAMNKGKQE